jgi:ent-copalyl diphosphate synthase
MITFIRWYSKSRLKEFGLNKRELLLAYFLAAASIFEPERSQERLAWAKTAAFLETITSYIRDDDLKKDFVKKFGDYINPQDYSIGW